MFAYYDQEFGYLLGETGDGWWGDADGGGVICYIFCFSSFLDSFFFIVLD